MPFFEHATDFKINGGDFSDVNGNQNNYYRTTNPRARAGFNTEDRAGGNVEEFGQGRGSQVKPGINAHLAQQSMRTWNGMYSPTQEYGIEHSYPRQYPHPSQFQYGANFQHQMHSQHPKGWCDPPMEYYPQSPQQATFNPSASPSPPPDYDWANSPSQMTGYPSDNYQYGWHHHNVPYSPPARYPPPASYPAANHQYMWNTPHPALPRTGYLPQTGPHPFHATGIPAGNNQYMGYHAPPHPGVLPQSHQPLPTTTPAPSTVPAEQVRASQEFAKVEFAAPAAVLSPADIKDTPLLPIDTVHVVHSNRPRQEQPPLAAPRPLVAGALTNILNPVPVAPSSAPPSANQALPAPATQRVERQDALMPPSISPVSASTLSQETPARLGKGSIISDSNGPTAIVTENVLPGTSKIKSTSQEVLPEEADAFSRAEITNDLLIPKSKIKGWRRLVIFINRQVKKFRKVQVKE